MSKHLFLVADKYIFDFIVLLISLHIFDAITTLLSGLRIAEQMARNGVAFASHFPAKNQASHQSTAHTTRRFTFTYDDLYNCLYRHNEPQLIDIEAFKAQMKGSQTEGERQKESASKSKIDSKSRLSFKAILSPCAQKYNFNKQHVCSVILIDFTFGTDRGQIVVISITLPPKSIHKNFSGFQFFTLLFSCVF